MVNVGEIGEYTSPMDPMGTFLAKNNGFHDLMFYFVDFFIEM